MHPFILSSTTLQLLARGGGGGSGGGGGGGGGILALGYVIPYFVTNTIRKRFGLNPAKFVGLPTTLVWMAIMVFIFQSSPFLSVAEVVSAGFGFYTAYFGVFASLRKKIKKTSDSITKAAALDPAWDIGALKEAVYSTFMSYQKDWGDMNTTEIARYTTPGYAQHMYLVLTALAQLGRRNMMSDITIDQIEFIEAIDSTTDQNDSFTVAINARAKDSLLDIRTNEVIYTDTDSFTEYWRFMRQSGGGWLLAGIDQATEHQTAKSMSVRSFAASKNLFYSPDWGWLLLPKLGTIFSKADFKKSDINNHCIGMWEDRLVQLYTYVPSKQNQRNQAPQEYSVAQIAVPNKNYGRIVVEQKTPWSMFKRTPKGLNKLQVESSAINSRFTLYADNIEQVTTFELMTPAYMEAVLAAPGKFNIEVYDNTIFIYSKDKKATYESMFDLLVRAHHELKR